MNSLNCYALAKMISPFWSAWRQNRFQSAWLLASSLNGGQYNCSSFQNTQSDTHIKHTHSHHLPFLCIISLLAAFPFLLCQSGLYCISGSLLCFVMDLLQAHLGLTGRVLLLSTDIDRSALCLYLYFVSNHCFSAHIPTCESF